MNSNDLVTRVQHLKAHLHDFVLDKSAWDAVPPVVPVPDWKTVPYVRSSRLAVPWNPGLYAFLVGPKHGLIPGHSYLLYVGKTGDGTSASTLRKRFGQYLREQNNPTGRPGVRYMLNSWQTHLSFAYAEIADKTSIGMLEDALIKATLPPYNKSIADAVVRYVAGGVFDR